MNENEDQGFTPLPPECIRARCGCTWWIAVKRQIERKSKCHYCGEPMRKITELDLRQAGRTLPEGETLERPRPRRQEPEPEQPRSNSQFGLW